MAPSFATLAPAPPGAARWVVLAVLVIAAAIASSPRLVPRGHWLLVLRSGRAVRLAESGLMFRSPGLERYLLLVRGTVRLPLAVTSRSAEGVDVRIWGELTVQIVDPVRAAAGSVVPLDVAADETERELARLVSRSDLMSLAELPSDAGVSIDVPGVRVDGLRIDRIEIELSTLVLEAVVSAARQAK